MEILFYGICTHLETMRPYRIALPASNGYTIDVPPISVPDHTPALSLFSTDIDAEDPEAALRAFEGRGMTRIANTMPNVIAWKLHGIKLTYDGVAEPFGRGDWRCMPHLAKTVNVELDPDVIAGSPTESVAAYVELPAGQLEMVIESSGARHSIVSGAAKPWTLLADGRSLPMRGDARVAFSNHEAASCDPCGDHDYLLHYRLTTTKYVHSDHFYLEPGCPRGKFDPHDFPIPGDITSTLLTCSNSTYP